MGVLAFKGNGVKLLKHVSHHKSYNLTQRINWTVERCSPHAGLKIRPCKL